MRREFRPLRLFVRENGKLYPTVLFYLIAGLILLILCAAGYLIFTNLREGQAVAAILTRTPPPTMTETNVPAPTDTVTPEPPPTEFVYDDPSEWEFIERFDPIQEQTFTDLQDWQKEQVSRAFTEFWNVLYRSENGLPGIEEVTGFVSGSMAESIENYYSDVEEIGYYLYLPALDALNVNTRLHSTEEGEVKVAVLVVTQDLFSPERRDLATGDPIETLALAERTLIYRMRFEDGNWVIFEFEANLNP